MAPPGAVAAPAGGAVMAPPGSKVVVNAPATVVTYPSAAPPPYHK